MKHLMVNMSPSGSGNYWECINCGEIYVTYNPHTFLGMIKFRIGIIILKLIGSKFAKCKENNK